MSTESLQARGFDDLINIDVLLFCSRFDLEWSQANDCNRTCSLQTAWSGGDVWNQDGNVQESTRVHS